MAAKKTANKRTARVVPQVVTDDGIYWVISERKLFRWVPMFVFKSREDAAAEARRLQEDSPFTFNAYKVDRVIRPEAMNPQDAVLVY